MASAVGIGLEIGDDQIRAVKLRRTRRGLQLLAFGSSPTPKGTVVGGIVHDETLLVDALRRFFKANDMSGARVVVGLPGRAAVSRALELPSMEREEMLSVVAGEMEHYRMVPAGQGTFDFLPLGKQEEHEQRTRLMLMAADGMLVDRYREVLRLSGRQLVALEPTMPASCRAAHRFLGEGGAAVVSVGARATDLAVFDDGVLCYSRQIDAGTLDLLGKDAPRAAAGATAPGQDSSSPDMEEGQSGLAHIGSPETASEALFYEIQRSIDFYRREAPSAPPIARIVLCADVAEMPELQQGLASSLGLPVTVCQPFEGMDYRGPRSNPETLSRVGPAYASAVGLALHAVGEESGVPRLDLSDTGRESHLARIAPKWLASSLTVSIILVVAALAASIVVARTLHIRQQRLNAVKAELEAVTKLEQERTRAARRAQEAITLVELRGLPWSDILFQVSEFMPPGVWLTNLTTVAQNQLSLEGISVSADNVATLMDYLTRSPLFAMPRVTSITQRRIGKRELLRYQIKVMVIQPATTPAAPVAEGGPQ
jgi:type IV pilus assembly protein PilM